MKMFGFRNWWRRQERLEALHEQDKEIPAPHCGHLGSTIAPDVADPDQRIICCHCGSRINDWFGLPPKEETRQRTRVEQFEELKAWVETLPEFEVRIEAGDLHFPAIYEPFKAMQEGMRPMYGVTVASDSLLEAFAVLDEQDMERIIEETAEFLTVKPPSTRKGGLDFPHINLSSTSRPVVYTRRHGASGTNHWEDLDALDKAFRRLAVQNLPKERLFRERPTRVHFKLYAYWTGSRSYQNMEKIGLKLQLTRVGIWP